MGHYGKIVLAVVTLWPVVYLTWFLALGAVAAPPAAMAMPGPVRPLVVELVPALNILTASLVGLMMVAYPLDALINRLLTPESRILWAILLVVGNVIAVPVYFVEHVWPERAEGRPRPARSRSTSRLPAKTLLGIATFLPVVALVLLVLGSFALFLGRPDGVQLSGVLGVVIFELVGALVRGTFLLTIALALFYVVHALYNERLGEAEGPIWAILLVIFNPVSLPVYYLRHIRHQ